jgi:hypothetical protein
MTFKATNTFVAGTKAEAAGVNQNFGDVESELNAFPTDGSLKNGAVEFKHLDNSAVEVASEGISASDVKVPTSNAVVEYSEPWQHQKFIRSGSITNIRNWTSPSVVKANISGLDHTKRNRIIIHGHINNAIDGEKGE